MPVVCQSRGDVCHVEAADYRNALGIDIRRDGGRDKAGGYSADADEVVFSIQYPVFAIPFMPTSVIQGPPVVFLGTPVLISGRSNRWLSGDERRRLRNG